jgi:hypothetical protein
MPIDSNWQFAPRGMRHEFSSKMCFMSLMFNQTNSLEIYPGVDITGYSLKQATEQDHLCSINLEGTCIHMARSALPSNDTQILVHGPETYHYLEHPRSIIQLSAKDGDFDTQE